MLLTTRNFILLLPFLLALATRISNAKASVISGSKQDACVGALSLYAEESDEPTRQILREEFAKDGYVILGRMYIHGGKREGNCCYRLKKKNGHYTDIHTDGHNIIKKRFHKIEMIDCVYKANIVVPVVATAFGIMVVVTVFVIFRKRMQRNRSEAVPTEEDVLPAKVP